MKVENCSTVPKRPCKIGMCTLGTLTRPRGKQWKIWRIYADIYKVRAGKLETLDKAQTTTKHGFSTFLPVLPPDFSLVISLHILTKEDNNKGNAHQEKQQ